MIIYEDNFLNEYEVNYLLGLWDDDSSYFAKKIITFYGIDLKNIHTELDLSPIHNNVFQRRFVHKMRLQKYNESFTQVEEFHGHENIHNYIIFLNDDFKGGELEFSNGLLIKPKRGSLVYFNNNESHRVLPCIGDRYVFTALGDIELNIKFKIREKTIF